MTFRRDRFVLCSAVCLLLLLPPVCGHAQEAQPNADFIAGVDLVRNEQYKDAVTKLQAATTGDPKLEGFGAEVRATVVVCWMTSPTAKSLNEVRPVAWVLVADFVPTVG
jgi:hypothetical protein